MRISDWSSGVCSSDLGILVDRVGHLAHGSLGRADRAPGHGRARQGLHAPCRRARPICPGEISEWPTTRSSRTGRLTRSGPATRRTCREPCRSDEHTSELTSLMRYSYAVLVMNKKKNMKNY